jgi:hypothetical protein
MSVPIENSLLTEFKINGQYTSELGLSDWIDIIPVR